MTTFFIDFMMTGCSSPAMCTCPTGWESLLYTIKNDFEQRLQPVYEYIISNDILYYAIFEFSFANPLVITLLPNNYCLNNNILKIFNRLFFENMNYIF